MILNIYKDTDDLTTALADWICSEVQKRLITQSRFTIALSGGNTPKQLFSKLASPPYNKKIDWSRMHIFWGDERLVPFEDERNNANMAFRELLNKVMVPESQVHVMRTDISAKASSIEYDQLLKSYFDKSKTSFDIILLGLGEDGHTLSLFPGIDIADNSNRWVLPVYLPSQKMWRITLTPAIVNRAAAVAFMVSGSSKAGIFKEVLQGDNFYPAKLIQPANGELYWFIDEQANGHPKMY